MRKKCNGPALFRGGGDFVPTKEEDLLSDISMVQDANAKGSEDTCVQRKNAEMVYLQ